MNYFLQNNIYGWIKLKEALFKLNLKRQALDPEIFDTLHQSLLQFLHNLIQTYFKNHWGCS